MNGIYEEAFFISTHAVQYYCTFKSTEDFVRTECDENVSKGQRNQICYTSLLAMS